MHRYLSANGAIGQIRGAQHRTTSYGGAITPKLLLLREPVNVSRLHGAPFPTQSHAIVAHPVTTSAPSVLMLPRRAVWFFTLTLLAAVSTFASGQNTANPRRNRPASLPKTLDIYIADTEGGKGTLFVTPSGQTLLIDTGNPGGRDVDRIMDMINSAV